MPDFEYRGAPGLYPTLRDAHGVLAGLVTPGDIREFDTPPGADWTYLDPGERERSEADRQALAAAIAELTAPPPAPASDEGSGSEPEPADADTGGEHDQDSGDAGTSSDEPAQPGDEED